MTTSGQSIHRQSLSRSTQLAFAFVLGTTALYGATYLLDLLLVFPDATTPSDRRLTALVLYPTAAAVAIAAAATVVSSRSVAFPPGRRAMLAAIAGGVVGASAIGSLWAFGAVGGVPAYVVFGVPIAVAAAVARRRGAAAAVVLSWTATMVCASAWLAHAMQHV